MATASNFWKSLRRYNVIDTCNIREQTKGQNDQSRLQRLHVLRHAKQIRAQFRLLQVKILVQTARESHDSNMGFLRLQTANVTNSMQW